jgi:hypothetical protein
MSSRLDARLRRLKAQRADTAWRHSPGISALLAQAKQCPREPCDDEQDLDDEPPTRGIARLLWEARQWQAKERRG